MDVNYEVWGAPETWVDSSEFPYADIKTPETSRNTFKKNYDSHRIPYNEIDLSLAFWGISKNAYFAQPKYLAPYTDNGVTGVKVYPVHNPVDMPCMFTATREDNGLQAYNQRYKPNVEEITGNTGAYNSAMITSFNYQKIMLIPYIAYTNDANDPPVYWDLKQYIDTDMPNGYNKIVGIGYRMYRGDGNTDREFVYPCGFAPVYTHDVDNYDVSYNDKIFYARGGYSQLTRGMSRDNSAGTLLAPYYSAFNRITINNTVDMTTALAYRYCTSENSHPNEIWYYFDDDPLWQINGDSVTSGYWCTYPYIHCDSSNVDEVKAYIFKQLAYLGLPFCYDEATALRGQIGDIGVYLPVFDSDGVTTGRYVEGTGALDLPNSDWTDARQGSGYDPDRPPPEVKPVKQSPYITVYSYLTPQTGFDNHGMFILTPTKCTIVEALNGRYELTIEHPIDPEGRWEAIRENNIIKALGQLFTIRTVTQKWQGKSGKITAKADHIFYQLSDWWLDRGNTGITGRTVMALLSLAGTKMVKHLSPSQTAYTYRYDSDMTVPDITGDYRWDFLSKGMTPIDFLMGSGGVMEVCGGELHRDNFRFSLYAQKEGAKENAFEIRVGKNLTGISRTIDASSIITYLKSWNNYGQWYAISWIGTETIGMPHYTVREKNFSYDLVDMFNRDETALAREMLQEDAKAYFTAYCAPLISYDIDLVDLRNNPEYEDLQLADEFKVGNWGYIYDERIGGKVLIEITETTTDAMTGEVTNVLFGSKRNFMNPANRTAIIDIDIEPEEMGFVVRDAEGAFVFDSEGSRIVEYEGV